MNIDPTKERREGMRWLLLLALNRGRPGGLGETILRRTVMDLYGETTEVEVRTAIEYLEARQLVTVARSSIAPEWRVALTRHGIDFAEYTIEGEPGIARPIKYW